MAVSGIKGLFPQSSQLRSDARTHFPLQISKWRLVAISQVLEAIIVAVTSLLTISVYLQVGKINLGYYFMATIVVIVIAQLFFKKFGLYRMEVLTDYKRAARETVKAWALTFLSVAMISFLARPADSFSRVWAVGWFCGGAAILLAERYFIWRIFRSCIRRGLFMQRIVLVGATDLAIQFIRKMRNNKFGIAIDGIFDNRLPKEIGAKEGKIEGVSLLGTVDDLLDYSRTQPVDTVIITLPMNAESQLREIIRTLRLQPLNVALLPGTLALEPVKANPSVAAELPGIFVMPVSQRPLSEWAFVVKRMLDFVLGTVALAAFSPLLLAVALTIKYQSPGPILFRQERFGFRGEKFFVYKFRTMHHAAQPSEKLTARGDSRIYPFGAFLRKTSIDELPQLFNVLKGEMSLVGPRPHVPTARAADRLYYEVVADYGTRHRVRPGITGWAQINGWRGPTETVDQICKRVEHDTYYIDNWSLSLDLWILFLTMFRGFVGKNAF